MAGMEVVMSYLIKLSKVEGGSALRTDVVEGSCIKLPVVGQSFTLYANSLDAAGGFRYIKTSEVKSVDIGIDAETGNKTYVIHTQNSAYRIEVLDTVGEPL